MIPIYLREQCMRFASELKLTFSLYLSNATYSFHALFLNFPVDSWTVESMAKAADMSVAEFAAQTGRALTGQTTGQDNFIYQARPQGSNLKVGIYAYCLGILPCDA